MQNVAATGLATFRSGSGADRFFRVFYVSLFGGTGFYFWAKDSESSFWPVVFMPLYRRIFIDEEYCHAKAVWWLKRGRGPFDYSKADPSLAMSLFGKQLAHPVMLGAGLDRDATCVFGCFGLGFSGVEVGSVTPQKQAGNGLPRIWKVRSDEAILSRTGNPSRGMAVVAYFLEEYQKWITTTGRPTHDQLLGVNVAKNKMSSDLIEDARIGVKVLSPSVDYITISIPPPVHQGDAAIRSKLWLEDLVASCNRARAKLPEEDRKPILFKVPLDMTEADTKIVCQVAKEKGIEGLVVGHGTIGRPGMLEFHFLARQPGLCYGRPIKEQSTELIRKLYCGTGGKVTIIGGGGVCNGEDALEKIEAGATAVQIHSALVHQGPGVIPKIKAELALALETNGYDTVADAVGKFAHA
eukprot:TRINITY_DN5042_c0_g4_i1.p1 TRINITY_DN5042_c0_g4~~TRINITY_DN5042_c0_g4_i1.p1  ORF type:complete len:430 (+),score=168.94 TRINITY_DN5042_c0_g4_i1:61-1290(+)